MIQKKPPIIELERAHQILKKSGIVLSDDQLMKMLDGLEALADLTIDRLTSISVNRNTSTHD